MENASKALIMAAGVLISVMVLSLAVYLFSVMGNFSKQKEEEMFGKQLAAFNDQFLKYEGSKEITAQNIVSIANLAKENNDYYELLPTDNAYISVFFKGRRIEQDINRNDFIRNNAYQPNGELIYYTCVSVEYDKISGRVNKIIFQNT